MLRSDDKDCWYSSHTPLMWLSIMLTAWLSCLWFSQKISMRNGWLLETVIFALQISWICFTLQAPFPTTLCLRAKEGSVCCIWIIWWCSSGSIKMVRFDEIFEVASGCGRDSSQTAWAQIENKCCCKVWLQNRDGNCLNREFSWTASAQLERESCSKV